MNKTFKVVFNKARGALMVVNEATSSVQKKGTKTVIAAALTAMMAGVAGTADARLAFGGAAGTVDQTNQPSAAGKKIIGGWNVENSATYDEHKTADTNLTIDAYKVVEGSKVPYALDETIGGNHVKQVTTSRDYSIKSATTVINETSGIHYVIGGSKGNNATGTFNLESVSLTINGGSNLGVAEETEDRDEPGYVIGGSYLKASDGKDSGVGGDLSSTIGTTEVNVSGGAFAGTLIGGSFAGPYNGNGTETDTHNAITTNTTITTTITGGSFKASSGMEASIVGGSVASGTIANTTVTSSTTTITGGADFNGTFSGNVHGASMAINGGEVQHEKSTLKFIGNSADDRLKIANSKLSAYAGGFNSTVSGQATLILENVDFVNVKNGFYAGSKLNGAKAGEYTEGNTAAIVTGFTGMTDIRGGAGIFSSNVNFTGGDTSVTVTDSTVSGYDSEGDTWPGRVFGNGIVEKTNSTVASYGTSTVTINDNVFGLTYDQESGEVSHNPGIRVYGTGQMYEAKNSLLTTKKAFVTVNGANTQLDEVYGGGSISGNCDANMLSTLVTGQTSVTVNDGLVATQVIGGNNSNLFGYSVIGAATDASAEGAVQVGSRWYTGGMTDVIVNGGDLSTATVVGGSLADWGSWEMPKGGQGAKSFREAVVVGSTNVTVNGGTVNEVVGGGLAIMKVDKTWTAKKNGVEVTINEYVYKEANSPVSTVVGSSNVTITGGTITGLVVAGGYAYGTHLSPDATVTGDTTLSITGGTFKDGVNIFGGGVAAADYSYVPEVNNEADDYYVNPTPIALVDGNANIIISGGTFADTVSIYAGGNSDNSRVTGDATVTFLSDVGFAGKVSGINVDGTATLAFGSADNVFNAVFKGTFEAFDKLTVAKGSAVTLAELNNSNIGTSLNLNGAGSVKVQKINQTAGTLTVSNGTLDVSAATLGADSLKFTTVKTGGTIAGLSAQFFENGLGADGLNANTGAYTGHGLTIDGGSLTLNDGKYNIAYVGAAALATNNAFKIVFTGDLVAPSTPVVPTPDPDPENPGTGDIVIDDSTGSGTGAGSEGGTGSTGIQISTDNKITADDVNNTEGIGNVIMTEVVMSTKKDDDSLTKDDLIIGAALEAGESEATTNIIKSNLGVKAVEVSAASQTVKVNDGKVLTLVGGGDDLIQGSEKDVTLKIGDSKSVGYVQLGVKAEGVKNGGTLNTDVEIRQGSLLAVSAGTFEAPKQIKTAGVVTVADNSELKVNNLVVEGDFSSVQVSGTLEVATLGDKDTAAGAGVIYVGNAETNGSVKVGTSHGGHRFFLDPAFNDKGIEGASSLVYGDAAVVDKILVGENSYAVIGATDDAEFVSTFKRSGMTWGADGVKAALFVGQPITINATTGGLTIDGTKTEWAEPAANSVNITNDSVVIADVTKLNAAGAGSLITAGTINVGEKAKAILVNVQSGTEYSLVSNGTGFAADNIVAANAMFGIAEGAGSTSDKAVFELQGAQSVYGNLLQGQALADAAMQSASTSDAYQYVNGLLTDVNGDNRAAAARFDAAMNPAGTLGVFTTALDRATELTNAVREEAGSAQQPRLWAKISGGKTKLDGLSTKAQSLDLKTTSYGLIVGGEAPVNGTVLGAAFSAGSGDTKNDSLSGKDEFDYYGLSAYAQREIAGITFTGDIGAAWLSSELKIGAADVKNDADTAVYKLGIEGKKAFDLGSAVVTPFVGLDVYHIKADSYKTNHGVQVASSDATVVEVPIGAQFKGSFETAQGMTVVPSFSSAVVPMLGDKDIDSKVKFAGAESNYNFTFADDVKVRTNFAVNAETKNFRFGAHLGFEWGNEERQSFSGGVKASYLF